MICKCGETVHSVRTAAGYRTCVKCSTESKWGSVQVIYHKTGNTIEIVKDPELAAQVNQMARRSGFGVMKGITGVTRKQHSGPQTVKPLPPKPVVDREISRRPLETDWELVGEEAMRLAEINSIESAVEHIYKAHKERRILQKQADQLIQIIGHVLHHVSRP